MKITFLVLSFCLALCILYFLFNAYFPKKNKLNTRIKLATRKDAIKYLVITLLLVPVLGSAINKHIDQIYAESQGFSSFSALQASRIKAETLGIAFTEYQTIMTAAKAAGFTDYYHYQNFLLAQKHGYDSYQAYTSDMHFANNYGFPLVVYKKAKAEAARLNYQYFDDYLLYKEKKDLAIKLAAVADFSGNYTIENVPLGAKISQLTERIKDCKIKKLPDYRFPVSKTLAPRNNAHVNHFFPATKESASGFGLTAYSLNFTVMPGLDLQAISKYEMICNGQRYDLWFLNSDDSLVMYEKKLSLPANGYQAVLTQLESVLSHKCDSEITIGLETSFEENGTRAIKNFYCKKFQEYILATVIDGPVITGIRHNPSIHIGYLNDRLWKKYINNLHTIKNKKRKARIIEVEKKERIIEDRI